MPYLIDGHNLIAQMPGVHLSDPDDEATLCAALQRFCARTRSRATVYFDQGRLDAEDPPLSSRLAIRFVRPPQTADEAIRRHLGRLRGEARNWTVVSTDAEVRRAAERAGARTLTSRDFARLVEGSPAPDAEKPDTALSKEEIAEWERRFRRR